MDELLYSCVKLELLANLDSNKKDENLRKTIQLEFLTNKFNKSYKNNTNDLESILINFIDNCSAEDLEADHKKLWKRIYKCLEVII